MMLRFNMWLETLSSTAVAASVLLLFSTRPPVTIEDLFVFIWEK